MRRAARTDGNHAEIRDGLRGAGVLVHDTSNQGGGFPDLVCRGVGAKRDRIVLLELKDGELAPSRRALTVDEERFHGNWRGCEVHVVETLAEALAAVGAEVT